MQKILFCWGFFLLVIVGLEAQNSFLVNQQSTTVNGKVSYNNHVTSPDNIGILLPTFTISRIIEASEHVLIKKQDTAIFKAGTDGYIRVKKGTNSKGVIAQKGSFFRAYIEPISNDLVQETTDELPILNTSPSKIETVQVKAYPNPFKDRFTIHLELIQASNISIELIDPSGRRLHGPLKNHQLTKGSNQIEMVGTHLVPGMYHCKVRIGQEEIVKSILKL